jgi:hypothetical protein
VGHKTCGPEGRYHTGIEEFAFDALTGEPVELGFSTYRALPVDLDGDGFHELVRSNGPTDDLDGAVLDRHGRKIAQLDGHVALAGKLLQLPGEQLLLWRPEGEVSVVADADAMDTDFALARYANPFYELGARPRSALSGL